ncbi:MAG TPA: site-specific integrase [Noviherbaspirillum sp.]|nr:site-specific integrase [Noviherbaspirillum sp.]
MAQAKTLTEKELKKILIYISLHRHAARNRAMLLLTHWAGMRVGEVAALRVGDVVAPDGSIKPEIRLLPEQTKGRHARTVFLGERLRKELAAYVATLKRPSHEKPLFYTQKRLAFSANTLCQHFHVLYKQVGIDGASSHSGRRSFITNLASKGVGVRVLMALAGHRNISTTQAYIDVNDEMQRAAVDLI